MIETPLARILTLLYSCGMGILHYSDIKKGIIYIVWDGEVTWDDWRKQIQTLLADPAWPVFPRFIADLWTVSDTSTIGYEEIDEAVSIFTSNQTALGNKRGAVVARDVFGKAGRFVKQIARFGTSMVVFNNLDTACLFLGIDLHETHQTLERLRATLRSRAAKIE
jgi:hypothetical protein